MKKLPIRLTMPKPTRVHTSKKGKKGYKRQDNKKAIRVITTYEVKRA